MRTRGLASLVTCLLLAYGCGGTTTGNDARDAKDSGPDVSVDRPADSGTGGKGGSGGSGGSGGAGGSDAKDAPADVPGSDLKVDGVVDGGPPPCTLASECPGQDSECRHRVCAAGVCGMANETTGKVLAAQTIGDCKVRACGADGLPAVGNDDLDKPDDLNPCTNDLCQNGTASHTNAAAATACGNGKMCNATGQCVGCTVASDCPGTDNECRTRTCIQSTCGVTLKAAGTKVTDPTPGDCKGRQCDGQGVIQVADLSTDVPTDNNACTVDQCNGGTPNTTPAPRNSSCGGTKICDGASHCVECLTAATCPGTDSECQTRVCNAGVCGVANAPSGTVVSSQTAGDCKKDQCNGQGVVVSVADNTDTHNDNNACTDDVCTAGVVSNPPKAATVACGANLMCDGAGHCVGCLTAADCEPDGPCVTHACSPSGMCITNYVAAGTAAGTQVAKDCKKKQCDGAGNIAEVNDNDDVPVDGTVCTTDVCTAGVPSNPAVPVGMACPEGGGIKCNGNGACVACIAPADCGPETVCKKFTCSGAGVCGRNDPPAGTDAGGQTAGDCKKKVCDGLGAESPTPQDDNTDVPDDASVCTADSCVTGMPTFTPANTGATCGSGSTPQICDNAGHCVGCVIAADCGVDSACRTFSCTNNMCGHTDAADGTPLPADPTAGDCKTAVCDGMGATRAVNLDTDLPNDNNACTTDVCTAGVMSHGSEPSSKGCSTGGVQCDGAGTCGPALVVVNEVTSNNPDRFELYNSSATIAVDISGWVMKDDTDTGATHIFVFPANTVLQPHQFKDFLSATFLVGLSSADQVRLFAADGTTLITSVTWTNHPTWTGQPTGTVTWGRCPDGTGPFRLNFTATPEAANDCSMTAPAAPLPPTSSP